MFHVLLFSLISLTRSQTYGVAWANSASERNVRVVFAASDCSGYGRVEVWKNGVWNALSDCFSTSRYFTQLEADAVCEQVGFTLGASSLGYEFYTDSSVPMQLKTASPTNRLYAGSMFCSTRTTSEFCDGCSITTSTSTSQCSSTVYRSLSTSSSNPGMWSGSRNYNRDVFVDCSGSISTGTCNTISGAANLYTSTQNPSASACKLSRSTATLSPGAAAALGAIVVFYIICSILCFCCIIGFVGFVIVGGGVAICQCLQPRKKPAAAAVTTTAVVVQPAQQPGPAEGYGQTTTTTAPAVGYGQPQQPVQYGAAPGYGDAPTQGYPPQQAGYAPQGYAQPAAGGAPGYAPQGGYAPGYAPAGGAPPTYGQPAAGGPPAYAPAGGAPGNAPPQY